jgi:hypothetical protein
MMLVQREIGGYDAFHVLVARQETYDAAVIEALINPLLEERPP